jgi:hypothetical protein
VTDHAGSVVDAIETVGGVITDLVQIAERLPVRPGEAEPVARILDRLAEEISEAAQLLRSAGGQSVSSSSRPAGTQVRP